MPQTVVRTFGLTLSFATDLATEKGTRINE